MRVRISDIAAETDKHRLEVVRVLHRGLLHVTRSAGIAAIWVCNDFLFHRVHLLNLSFPLPFPQNRGKIRTKQEELYV